MVWKEYILLRYPIFQAYAYLSNNLDIYSAPQRVSLRLCFAAASRKENKLAKMHPHIHLKQARSQNRFMFLALPIVASTAAIFRIYGTNLYQFLYRFTRTVQNITNRITNVVHLAAHWYSISGTSLYLF